MQPGLSEGAQGADRLSGTESPRRDRSEGRGHPALRVRRLSKKPRLRAGLFLWRSGIPRDGTCAPHSAMTLLRGIADDVALKPWLEEHIWPREGRFISAEFVHDGTLLAAGEMLRSGITCCADQYFFPDAAARAYRQSGIRAFIGLPVLDFPTPYAADAGGYLQAGLAARDAWKHEPKFAFALAPHAPYTVGHSSWEQIVVYARQLDLPIQTHLQETRDELEQSLGTHAISPLARLDRLGVTGPNFIAVHAVHLRDSDVE